MKRGWFTIALAALLLFGADRAHAQDTIAHRPPPARGWSPLRVGKWAALGASAGAAVYGYRQNERADDRYAALERACVADPEACRPRTAGGQYESAELEAQYQEVRRLDRRARRALLVSQVGVAASVVLFIVDLRNARAPDDILYEPRPLEIGPARDGGIELRLTLYR